MGNNTSNEEDDNSNNSTPNNEEEEPGYWDMVKQGHTELVNAIVRPPRASYLPFQLGPERFAYGGREFQRTDFELVNPRGFSVKCSHWEPVERPSEELPCIIYMHGNSSARVEAVSSLNMLLALGGSVVAFDFAGSGQSEGDFVSLGFYERDDLGCLIDHLRGERRVSMIGLWGRSMGAATALMHVERDPSIAAMILDSPFSNLTTLAEEMVEKGKEQGIAVPSFVVKLAIRFIRSSVQSKAEFDIYDIAPINHAERCFVPALFVAGDQDDFINPRHSQDIHDQYAGDKNIVIVDGDHNSPRPSFLHDSAFIFLQQYLQVESLIFILRSHIFFF